MAKRPIFLVNLDKEKPVKQVQVDFIWSAGFSKTQKQRNVNLMHEIYLKQNSEAKILEISTASQSELGRTLSAFNLMIPSTKTDLSYSVEAIFQSSKVFTNGGPYIDMKFMEPRKIKKDKRLIESGSLVAFLYGDHSPWSLTPNTLFYDWIYMNALQLHPELISKVLEYNAFTDIEFNPKKSVNCQARSLAMYLSLYKQGIIAEVLRDREHYENYRKRICRL